MPEVNFFDHFELPWAKNGAAEPITDSQWQAGWSFIGATPPSVEQFNKLQQMSDQKAAWLFLQFKALAESAGLALGADIPSTLVEGITGLTPGRLLGVRQFLTPGQSTYVATPGTKSVIVEMVGGGGGGGGVPATGPTSVSVSGAGGAGAYAKGMFTSNFDQVVVTVGGGGAGGAIGVNPGSPGGTSSFGSLISAPGGTGGASIPASAPPVSRGGSIASPPPAGGNILQFRGSAGGGSSSWNGNVGTFGVGAASFFGGGGAASDSYSPGAGGGGRVSPFSTEAMAGYAGGNGIVTVWEYA